LKLGWATFWAISLQTLLVTLFSTYLLLHGSPGPGRHGGDFLLGSLNTAIRLFDVQLKERFGGVLHLPGFGELVKKYN
jgi:hypothetical protein